MLGMSNSLRQRLGNDPEPHLHPDADLLTAYVERSLSPVEQADMVRHLAACSYCREVVALSLPELQIQPAAASLPGRYTSWLPMWRWAAVAATVVVGATLVIEKPWKPAVFVPGPASREAVAGNSATGNSKQVPATAPQVEVEPRQAAPLQSSLQSTQPGPAASQPLRTGNAAKADVTVSRNDQPGSVTHAFAGRLDETRSGEAYSYSAERARDAASNGALLADSIAPPSPVNATEANLVSAPTPKTAETGQPSETGFVVRRIPITADNIANSSFAVAFDNAKKETPGYRASTDNLGSARIFKIPAKVLAAGKDKLAGAMTSRPSSGMALMEKAPVAHLHWSISPEGKLIKSSDLTMWHEAYPQKDNLLFTVVVAEGHDVWAGGNHMTLIHSWNGGVDWKKLKLGDAATGDITDIQINEGDVQVKTSNNQTFVSQDGGVTWVPLNQQPK